MFSREHLGVVFPPSHDLRCTNGDVLVVLCEKVIDYVLLLPSAPFERSDYFRPRFTGAWQEKDRDDLYATIKRPDGTEKKVHRFVLTESGTYHSNDFYTLGAGAKAADACLLQHKANGKWVTLHNQPNLHVPFGATDDHRENRLPFYMAKDASGFVLHEKHQSRTHCRANFVNIIAHKALLAYVLNRPWDASQGKINVTSELFANVIALAEMYDFLKIIVGGIRRDLQLLKNFWEDLSENPRFYLALAAKLKDKVIFTEALRHTVAKHNPSSPSNIFAAVASSTGLSDQDIEQLVDKYWHKMDYIASKAERLVARTGLLSSSWKKIGQAENTVFGTNKSCTNSEHYKSLVRWVFREWFDNQWLAYSNEPMKRYSLFKQIIGSKSYNAEDNKSILGEAIHIKIAGTFVARPVRTDDDSDKLVRHPRVYIANFMQWFFREQSRVLSRFFDQHDCSRVDVDYFTHFDFDERDIPWEVEGDVDEAARVADEAALEAAGLRGDGSRKRKRDGDEEED